MGALPEPWPSLRREMEKLKEGQRALCNRSPFFGTPIRPRADGGINSTNFDGDLNAGNPGTKGWAMDDDQAAFGQLILRDGIVGNAALTNPVIPGQQFIGGNSFGVTVAGAYVLSRTATVPAGCDTVTVTAYGRVSAINSTASDDALYSTIDINGAGGNQFGTDVRAGKFSTSSVGFATTLTGLTPGGSVVTRLYASTGLATWASNAANGADLSVTYLWTR